MDKALTQQIAERKALMERLLAAHRAAGKAGTPPQYEALQMGLAALEQRLTQMPPTSQSVGKFKPPLAVTPKWNRTTFVFPFVDGENHLLTAQARADGRAPRVVGNLPTVAGQWRYTEEGAEATYTRGELECALAVREALLDILEPNEVEHE